MNNAILCLSNFLLAMPFAQTKAAQNIQPNILWITIEDTSPQFVGCYGNQVARTPAIDKLASEGVRFTNAFSTGTISSPSRSAIITGVKVFEMGTGHHRRQIPIPNYIHGFPHYLQKAGYYTCNNWKEDYNVANAAQFSKDMWHESSNEAGWWKRKPGQPFFAVFNFFESHQSRTMTYPFERYKEAILNNLAPDEITNDDDFDMPPFYRDSPEMRKHHARVYNSVTAADKRIGELLDRLEKENLKDSTIIFVYADHGQGIPRGKMNGINLGYRVPFVIWFPEIYKNLSPWGTGGIVTDELIDFTDLAPTLISLAGGDIPDYLKGRILMGEKRSEPSKMLFLSLDRGDNGPDMVRTVTNGNYVYCRNYMPFMPEHRYIRYSTISPVFQLMQKDLADNNLDEVQRSGFEERPSEFLFNIENDKWEISNLINEPEAQVILNGMRQALYENILQSRDVMFLPEYEINLISKTVTPYEYRLLGSNTYPLPQILASANLSGRRGTDIALRQVDLLNDTNRIVRYWAITGLRSQKSEILKLYKEQIINSMQDNYPPVIITASAIAYQEFNNKTAEVNLKKFIADSNIDLALMAVNYLMYIKNKQPFISIIQECIKIEHSKSEEARRMTYFLASAYQDFLGSLGLVPNTMEYER